MAPPTRTSDKGTLARWLAEVRTQAQMVELTEQEFGHRVSRSAIANALVRFGLAGSTPRYHDYIPWRINPVHATAHPLRMLRLLGRRGENNFLNQREMDMLDSWLKQMKDKEFIVGYDPNDSRGFHYINKKYKDHKDKKEPKGFQTSVYKEPKVLLVLVIQVLQVLPGLKELKELLE